MAASLQSPEQELRFTRSRQAVAFWLAAAVMAMATIVIVAVSFHRAENPELPHPAWALVPAVAAALLARGAVRLTRHAYLILTPLGIEIFPFFRPASGMRLVAWQELREMDADSALTRLTLHYNVEKTSGIHLSLRPIRADRRHLLVEAVRRRLGQ
ncbi:MAG TPA: hypothetical protein VLO11_02800 [Luteolibacter sp.]|nr:hypothetical protein [Luteolibacter sp.]